MYDMTKAMTSRASRRGVLKGGTALGLGAIGLGPVAGRVASAQDGGQLEIFSWWTSPGEATERKPEPMPTLQPNSSSSSSPAETSFAIWIH